MDTNPTQEHKHTYALTRITERDKNSVLCSTVVRMLILISMCLPHHHSRWLDWPLVRMTRGNLCLTGGSRNKSHSDEQSTASIIIFFIYPLTSGRFYLIRAKNKVHKTTSVWSFFPSFSGDLGSVGIVESKILHGLTWNACSFKQVYCLTCVNVPHRCIRAHCSKPSIHIVPLLN